jgi:Tfp pilus assembly protein PilO
MKLSKREQIFLLALVIVLSFFLFNRFLYQPIKEDTAKLAAENMKLKGLVEDEQVRLERSQEMENEKERLKERYKEMMVKLPEEAYIPEVIAYLEKSAQDSSVELLSVRYQAQDNSSDPGQEKKQPEKGAARPCHFAVSANGSYLNLMTLLTKIEGSPRLYIINSAEIAASERKVEALPESPAQTVEGVEIPTPPPQELKGSARFDDSNWNMQLQLTTYYDPASAGEITGMPEKIAPGEGKETL